MVFSSKKSWLLEIVASSSKIIATSLIVLVLLLKFWIISNNFFSLKIVLSSFLIDYAQKSRHSQKRLTQDRSSGAEN